MNKPSGKLAFAYATIANLEEKIARLEAAQPAPVAFNGAAMNELRQIFDSNKGADGTLVISKRLASELLRK